MGTNKTHLYLLFYFCFIYRQDWPNILQTIVSNINKRPSKSLEGRSPSSLNGLQYTELAREIRKRVQDKRKLGKKTIKEPAEFQIGAYVYLLLDRSTFYKSFDRGATAIYRIRRIDARKSPHLYYLTDLNGDKIPESHYG